MASHVKSNHSNYLEVMTEAKAAEEKTKGTTLMTKHFTAVGDKAYLYFKWVEWIVMNNFPLSFVANDLNRANCTLQPIARNTLTKHLHIIAEEV